MLDHNIILICILFLNTLFFYIITQRCTREKHQCIDSHILEALEHTHHKIKFLRHFLMAEQNTQIEASLDTLRPKRLKGSFVKLMSHEPISQCILKMHTTFMPFYLSAHVNPIFIKEKIIMTSKQTETGDKISFFCCWVYTFFTRLFFFVNVFSHFS